VGSEIVVFPTFLTYQASLDPILTGDELFVMTNDGIRQAGIDYEETFGGPKGKIRIVRDLPPNTRLRARTLTAFGSALLAKPAGVDLQTAYNGGNIVVEIAGRPVDLRAGDAAIGGSALDITGSLRIDGTFGPTVPGGLFGKSDKGFNIGREDNKPLESWKGFSYVKSHDSHPGSALLVRTQADVSVGTSAKVITNSEIFIPEGRVFRIKLKATARRSDGTQGAASFTTEGTFYRVAGGVALAAGSPTIQVVGFSGDGANYAMTFGLTASVNPLINDEVVAVVFGNGTVQWAITMEIQSVGSAA